MDLDKRNYIDSLTDDLFVESNNVAEVDVAIVSGLFTLSVAAFTVAAQVWLQRKEQHKRDNDRIKSRRLKVISDLVSHRYVIAGRPNPRGVAQFNAALDRIPIEFLEYKGIIGLYHEIGIDFEVSDLFDFASYVQRK